MRVILFQDRFAEMVRRGNKRQTIRKSARCKLGDVLSLRKWSGKPYRSKQEVMREAVVAIVYDVEIDAHGIALDGAPISRTLVAICDGFANWPEMREWFHATHGLPFTGHLICWDI
jgi:hypothetical protein